MFISNRVMSTPKFEDTQPIGAAIPDSRGIENILFPSYDDLANDCAPRVV
jgi:hypothetical protein